MHAYASQAPKFKGKNQNLANLNKDLIFVLEHYIDSIDNEEIKKHFNYSKTPKKWQENVTDEAAKPDDAQTVQDEAKKEVEHIDSPEAE